MNEDSTTKTDKIVSAHQPHYLPWIGYLHKMALSDKMVIMDNVEFTRYSFINRNNILRMGGILMLAVPVYYKHSSRALIKDVRIAASSHGWANKHLKSIIHSYSKSSGFEHFFPKLEKIYQHKYEWLLELDVALLSLFKECLKIPSEIVIASEQCIGGAKEDEMFLSILEKTGSTALLLGMGASRQYINKRPILEKNYKIALQEFRHPVYPQNSKSFTPGISVVDLLMNVSQEEAIDLMQNSGGYSFINCGSNMFAT